MKFGRRLKSEQYTAWHDQYLVRIPVLSPKGAL